MNRQKDCITAKKLRTKIIVLGIMLVAIIGFVLYSYTKKIEQENAYTPPAFEKCAQAISGDAVPDESYSVLDVSEGYQVGICGAPKISHGKLFVYFTNPEENKTWLQLYIKDEEKHVIAKSGIVRPGECLEELDMSELPDEDGQNITMVVMGYEPDTYYSAGEVSLKTTIYPEDK